MKKLFLFLLATLALTSCDGNDKTAVRQELDTISQNKQQVLEAYRAEPYDFAAMSKMQPYFEEFAYLVSKLSQVDVKDRQKLSFDETPAELCSKVILERKVWQQIQNHCFDNEYYICSDEIRYYPDLLKALGSLLPRKIAGPLEGCLNQYRSN